MFPCEMARYIAGFSPEARKLGLFCRPPVTGPAGQPAVRGCQNSQIGRQAGIDMRFCTKLWPRTGSQKRGRKQANPRPIDSAGVRFSWSFRRSPTRETEIYLSELLIELNCELRLVPRLLTTAIIASAIPAAIRPYSIAVAPHHTPKPQQGAIQYCLLWIFVLAGSPPRQYSRQVKASLIS